MKRAMYVFASTVLLGLVGLTPTSAFAAPSGQALALPKGELASATGVVQVHWRGYRHCHWRHGWRRCHGGYYGYYGPGVYLHFGHRHRFHRNRHFGHHRGFHRRGFGHHRGFRRHGGHGRHRR